MYWDIFPAPVLIARECIALGGMSPRLRFGKRSLGDVLALAPGTGYRSTGIQRIPPISAAKCEEEEESHA